MDQLQQNMYCSTENKNFLLIYFQVLKMDSDSMLEDFAVPGLLGRYQHGPALSFHQKKSNCEAFIPHTLWVHWCQFQGRQIFFSGILNFQRKTNLWIFCFETDEKYTFWHLWRLTRRRSGFCSHRIRKCPKN